MLDEDSVVTGEFEAVELVLDAEGNPVIPMVTEEWIWAMQAVATEMRKDKRFRVDSEEFFRPVPDIVKETVQSAAGMVAAPTVASLYNVTDGYELQWSYERGGALMPAGSIHLYGFAEVFGSWLHKIWGEYPEGADQAAEDFTWEIRALDAAREDHPFQVVMHTPEVLPTYTLFWHSPHGKTYRLRVDFLEYLECLTETRGLFGWQYMVCDVDLTEDAEALERVRECTAQMRTMFPRVDLSRYSTIGDDDERRDEEE
jgi:hypothetical protein